MTVISQIRLEIILIGIGNGKRTSQAENQK